MKTVRNLRFSSLAVALACVSLAAAEQHPTAPQLSSLPGATYTIYLDFSGFNYPGTWANRTPGNVPAFDNTSSSGSFSTADTAAIQNMWAYTAQKYAGFNINVTTVDPAAAGMTDAQRFAYYNASAQTMHTLVSPSDFYPGVGGVSYVGFTQSAQPANSEFHTNWVFPQNLGNNDVQDVGEAAGHENGHGLSLSHQHKENGSGEYTEGDYNGGAPYRGAGTYGAIMGDAYYVQRGTWRSSSLQGNANDVAVLLSNRGMVLTNDGIGHSLATATSLAIDGAGNVNAGLAKGVIVPSSSSNPQPLGASNYTSDYFRFHTNGGLVSLVEHDGTSFLATGTADPGATLQGKLQIFTATGILVATATQDASTLFRTFSGNLASGDYYALVTSIGGYQSTYYDTGAGYYTMGGYFLTGSGFSNVTATPEPATFAALTIGMGAFLRRRRKA